MVARAAWSSAALGLAVVFGVAAWLNPYDADGPPRTMATHRQLGMPPCNFVTADRQAVPVVRDDDELRPARPGRRGASLRANWVGTLLALFWAALMPWALASGVRGRPLFVPRGRGELLTTVVVGLFLALMLGRWAAVLLQKR